MRRPVGGPVAKAPAPTVVVSTPIPVQELRQVAATAGSVICRPNVCHCTFCIVNHAMGESTGEPGAAPPWTTNTARLHDGIFGQLHLCPMCMGLYLMIKAARLAPRALVPLLTRHAAANADIWTKMVDEATALQSGVVGMYAAMRRPDRVRPVEDAARSPVNAELTEEDEDDDEEGEEEEGLNRIEGEESSEEELTGPVLLERSRAVQQLKRRQAELEAELEEIAGALQQVWKAKSEFQVIVDRAIRPREVA